MTSQVTRFPGGINANDPGSIFADLASATSPRALWEELFDFSLKADINGGDNQWSTFGVGTVIYPDVPFGVAQLTSDPANSFGMNQEHCQGFDFTRDTDLWYRALLGSADGLDGIWAGMTDAEPTGANFDVYDEACVFHVLSTGQIDLEIWSGANPTPIQTIANVGALPSDGTYMELGYHYDGTNIEVALNDVRVAAAAVPVVPDIALHHVMSGRQDGSVLFDYVYSAQLRQ